MMTLAPQQADARHGTQLSAQPRMRVRRAWADHLGQYEWTHFVTVTTRLPHTPRQLKRAFEHGYVRRLTRITQGPVPWFCVVENGAHGSAHLHALLAQTERLHVDQLRAAWKLGHTHAEPYEDRRGAAYYLTKEMAAGTERGVLTEAEYDVSARQPARRSRATA